MDKTKLQLWCLAIFLFILYGIVGHLDYKLQVQEFAWQESKQALEVQQEKLQLDILEVREELAKTDEQLQAHNLLIWNIRDRLHLDLESELEK